MITKQVVVELPVLKGTDPSLPWYVEYRFFNPRKNKMERRRIYKGLTDKTPVAERKKRAAEIIDFYSEKLRRGWLPLKETVNMDDSPEMAETISCISGQVFHFSKLAAPFMARYAHSLNSTYENYKTKINVFNRFLQTMNLENVDVRFLEKKDFEEFFKYLFRERNCGPTTVNLYLLLLRMMFEEFRKDGYLAKNPLSNFRYYKERQSQPKAFSPDMIIKLKMYMEKYNPQLWLISEFIFYCFIRPKELRLLQVKHIDMDAGIIHIPASISKNRRTQTVIIPDSFLLELLRKQINIYDGDDYIITLQGTPGPAPVSKNYMGNHFRKVRKALKLTDDYKLYSWKHTGAIEAVKAGINLRDLQNQLRHHSLNEVQGYIKQLMGEDSKDLRNKFPSI